MSAIFEVVRGIPPGRVASYGAVATRAGLKGRARLVGKVLSQFDAEPPLPWHRVLRADGRIAFPPGSVAHVEQLQRLRAEGVTVSEAGRVDLSLHGWQQEADLDRLLWG